MGNQKELVDAAIYPDQNVLQNLFGKGFSAYCSLLELFGKYDISYDWIYYNDVKCWLCKAQKKKKTIVWMSACKGHLRATIYFSESKINGLYELNISEELKSEIMNTKNTGKSKGCTFNITSKKILIGFEEVMKYKLLTL